MNKELGQQLLDAHGRDAYVLAVVLAERLLQQGGEAGCDPARKRREEFWLLEVYAINLVALGRCANAETALDRTDRIVTEERRPWLIHRRASIAEHRGNFGEALDIWKAAHAMAPDEATFLIHAAIMAFQLGRLSEAEELARRGTRCTKIS